MRNHAILTAVATAILLAGCGSDPQPDNPAAERADQQAPGVTVDRTFIGTAGRWSTAPGTISGDNRLVIDIASNGRFTADVRTQGTNAEAIIESGKGAATKDGDRITGTMDEGPGVHEILEGYSRWTIDTATGNITGTQSDAVPITKE
jgi:hypothetical protein